MAEFSRIQVTPAEEEDIVIVAGAVDEPVPASHADAPSAADEAAEEAVVLGAASSDAPQAQAAFEETTLEDLQHAGMSGMQKAIIALAIVAVAAFIIWYVLLR